MSCKFYLTRLEDICENLDRLREPISKKDRETGPYPYYGASGIVDYVADYIFDEDLLLVSEDGANLLDRTYPIAFSISGKNWVNNHAHVLRFEDRTYQSFIEYYLNSIKLDPWVSGMAQPKLNQRNLNSIPVPFPPLLEQKRVVAILDEAFELIDQAQLKVERNIKNAEELLQSKLEEIFSNRGDGWETRKLGDACDISMGQSPKGSTYNDKGIGTPLINGPVEFGPNPFSKTIKSKWTTDPKKICKKGDLILCVRGSTTGRINIAGFEACIGRGVASIRYDKKQQWLNYFIRANKENIYKMGSGSTFPNVSGKILKQIDFPEPPLEEQNKLIPVMDELTTDVKSILKLYASKLENIEELKKSILQKAFSGELTANEAIAI